MAEQNFVRFKENYFIGIKQIDQDHLELTNLTNKLYEACSLRTDKTNEYYISILKDLVNFANKHFAYEEELMKKYNYPELEKHTKEHSVFKTLIHNELKAIKYNRRQDPFKLARFLKDWLMHHVAIMDNDYKIFFLKLNIEEFHKKT